MRLDKFLKVSRLIKRRTVANEACDNGLVSVNDVRVSDDYSYATVYVNFLPNTFPHQKIAELQKTEGFVRSSLAKKMDIYKVPKVRFVLDETSSSAARIDEALAKEEKD